MGTRMTHRVRETASFRFHASEAQSCVQRQQWLNFAGEQTPWTDNGAAAMEYHAMPSLWEY